MSKHSTLKEVEGYDDTSNWTKIFTEKFYASLTEISQKVSEAEEISNKAKIAYEKASNDAKDAATLSLELREKLDKKILNKNIVIGHTNFKDLRSQLNRLMNILKNLL
jgi:hypothetical protein